MIPGFKQGQMMFQAVKDVPTFRRWYYTHGAPVSISRFRADLSTSVAANRKTLALVPSWLDEEVYRNSIFQYGLPPHIRVFIDDPIDDTPTYSDVIVHLARGIQSLRYLELGPSVGKNFFQVANAVKGAELVAVDIEDINPALERRLAFIDVQTWETAPGSKRARPSTHSVYELGGNRVEYIAGDLFDRATWERLRGRKFNLIFSDAFHSPEALTMEWDHVLRLDLLADGPFAMVWDDLTTAGMRDAFYAIASALARIRPRIKISLELFQGWVGKRERLHPVGIVTA
jgi:hypothetical protein